LKLIGAILLIFSYLYHFLLGLILTAIGSLALASGQNNLNLTMLPWKGEQLTYWVLALGIGAIVFVLLAVTNLLRWLFPIWCLIVVWLMFRGFFVAGTYTFSGPANFRTVVWLFIGAIVAFLASLQLYKPRTRKTRAARER
jgi:hypothetical protein